jgi:hypothetical protein
VIENIPAKPYSWRLYVTTNVYTGGSFGGLSGADTICDSNWSGLVKTSPAKALLSDISTNAFDRLIFDGPIKNASGATVITPPSHRMALWNATNLNVAINLKSGGSTAISSTMAWTGSNMLGGKNSSQCSNWTTNSSGMSGSAGTIANTANSLNGWFQLGTPPMCSASHYIYCAVRVYD